MPVLERHAPLKNVVLIRVKIVKILFKKLSLSGRSGQVGWLIMLEIRLNLAHLGWNLAKD